MLKIMKNENLFFTNRIIIQKNFYFNSNFVLQYVSLKIIFKSFW